MMRGSGVVAVLAVAVAVAIGTAPGGAIGTAVGARATGASATATTLGPSAPPLVQTGQPEATSLLGRPLFPPPLSDTARGRMEADLTAARTAWEVNRKDADAIIWYGRRTAYLGRFRDAIGIFTDGIAAHPNDPRMYRHRGHRYLTVREIDRAIADFEQAAALIKGRPDEVEPDGQPNARNIPTSTLHSNIWYHLALAHYLKADYTRALPAWQSARAAGRNPDNLVAASHWLYTTLRRMGRTSDAAAVLVPIRADLDVIENGSYHSLLLLYKGERTPADLLGSADGTSAGSAVRYGVSAWHAYNGRQAEAVRMWESMVAAPDWPSFGHLAAEADLKNRR